MSEQGWEQLTLFREDSPASRSLLPGSGEARMMTVTSGQRCLELYRKSGPVGSLVRTCLASSVWRSTRCYLSWKPAATPAKRLLFRLVPSTPRTDGTGSVFWPTPTMRDYKGANSLRHLMQEGNHHRAQLANAVVLYSTPQARDYRTGQRERWENPKKTKNLNDQIGGQLNPTWVEWLMGYPVGWTDLNASETP